MKNEVKPVAALSLLGTIEMDATGERGGVFEARFEEVVAATAVAAKGTSSSTNSRS